MHCPKFDDFEFAVLHSRAFLNMKERTGRLQALRDEHHERQYREDNQHHRKCDREIDRSFQESVERVLERFLAQSDESKSAIFEMGHRMTQAFLEVAQNEQTNPEL